MLVLAQEQEVLAQLIFAQGGLKGSVPLFSTECKCRFSLITLVYQK